MSDPSSAIRPPSAGVNPEIRSNKRGLARPVRPDQPDDLARMELERDVGDGLHSAESDMEIGDLEHGVAGGHRRIGVSSVGTGGGAGQEDRSQQVGPIEQVSRRSAEADLAALHEVRPVCDLEGEVHALLDHDDGHAVVGQVAQDREHLGHDHRGQSEGELVDEQDPRPALEAHREREHLLLAAGQVAGRGLQEPGQDWEHLERARLPIGSRVRWLIGGGRCGATTSRGRGSRRP